MPGKNAQTPTKVVRKDYFRDGLFFFGLFSDLVIGGVGFFWLIQEVVFGLIFLGIPFPDWQVYFLLGVQNVPLILVTIYLIILFIGFIAYALFWRHLLLKVEKQQSVTVGFATVAFASMAIVFSLIPAGVVQLYGIWLVSVTGTPSKIWFIFGALPITALSIGALFGRTGMIYHWADNKRLMVETSYKRYGLVSSRRLLSELKHSR